MTDIGLIGAGNIGSVLAQLAVANGQSVVVSNSRGPQTLTDFVADHGDGVSAGTIEEAAAADVVVVTIPLNCLGDLPPALLTRRTVIDTMNYYPERDGQIEALDQGRTTTSELTATHFPEARIVKGFNNIVFTHLRDLARPHGATDRSTLPIAGDDAQAKAAVTGVMDRLGYDVLDTGALAASWRFENGQPAYCLPYAADPAALRASKPGNRPLRARTATRADIARALAAAERTRG